MKSLWAARKVLEGRLRSAPRILLFLDYDGTLVPIQPTPELARLSPRKKRLLVKLARRPRFKAGLLTGRSLEDIRKAAGIPGLFYAANYGLAIATPQGNWVHPEAKKRAVRFRKMLPRLARLAAEFPGVRIEDKTLTVAIHYRQFKGKLGLLKSRLEEMLCTHSGAFGLKTGKKIFEVYPAVKWDKGQALLKVKKMLGLRGAPLVVFVGDDRADEEAFRRMRKTDLAAAVGRRERTAARFFCKNSGEVVRFLEFLLKIDTDSKF